MSMNRIIAIGREFGSGGRELGRRLSEKLGFAYYDQEIISVLSPARAAASSSPAGKAGAFISLPGGRSSAAW